MTVTELIDGLVQVYGQHGNIQVESYAYADIEQPCALTNAELSIVRREGEKPPVAAIVGEQ